jgi:Skp family chaperone for outer membrane proteins
LLVINAAFSFAFAQNSPIGFVDLEDRLEASLSSVVNI